MSSGHSTSDNYKTLAFSETLSSTGWLFYKGNSRAYQEPIKDWIEEQDQTPALGSSPQELSGGLAVDEELLLGQAPVEGLLVSLLHRVCAYCQGRRRVEAARRAEEHPF